MVGQKQRIIRRFEREARKHLKEKKLTNNFLDTIMFSLTDIKRIIKFEGYACGHQGKPIFLDDNALSITAFYEWCESVGWKGDKSQCWECYCKESKNKQGCGKMFCFILDCGKIDETHSAHCIKHGRCIHRICGEGEFCPQCKLNKTKEFKENGKE